jgi:hypothetical protein
MLPLILILVAGAVLGAGLALMRRPRVEYQYFEVPTPQRPSTALEVPDLIDTFLADGFGRIECDRDSRYRHAESWRLWDVLTALRGPDAEGAHALKRRPTAVIRRRALPRTTLTPQYGIDIAPPEETFDVSSGSGDAHFRFHVRAADRQLTAMGR